MIIYRDDVDKSGLARVLKTHKGELHFLLPEKALDPIDERVEKVNNCSHYILFIDQKRKTNIFFYSIKGCEKEKRKRKKSVVMKIKKNYILKKKFFLCFFYYYFLFIMSKNKLEFFPSSFSFFIIYVELFFVVAII